MQLFGVLVTLVVISISSVFLYTHFSSPKGSNNQTPQQVVDTAGDTVTKADIQNLQSNLEQYRVMKGNYPDSLQELVSEHVLTTLPQNPKTNQPYKYDSNGTGYTLSTTLTDGSEFSVQK